MIDKDLKQYVSFSLKRWQRQSLGLEFGLEGESLPFDLQPLTQ